MTWKELAAVILHLRTVDLDKPACVRTRTPGAEARVLPIIGMDSLVPMEHDPVLATGEKTP